MGQRFREPKDFPGAAPEKRHMPKVERRKITPADVLSGGAAERPPHDPHRWERIVGDKEVVFADKHVVVFHDPVDEEHESQRIPGEVRCTLILKDDVHSLMDLGVTDENLNAHILHGIQQAAYKLGLEKKGFEVRAHVYSTQQRRPELRIKIRSGKPPKVGVSGDL
jgi:hypothetical protein